ncbi:MAG: zinc ribbon domain-containing protein [Candidatus Anaerobiospirillum pullicola]|uniref:Zinc ribbon domain-containing protein n=1 Tax=Candidatus Anaerobiospirillum pullicola TaxID=2838451 RepID=A0A948WY39_9GAMM|nr:zinc ribbon domain-containing protein [Candidatus Anaerobiospirillum pullicola]
MPFYEYRCSHCGHTLTKLQSINAPALTTCPECHQDTLVKLISASSCELKGVGVFGSSKHPFASEKPSPATPAAPASSACASCPHATQAS